MKSNFSITQALKEDVLKKEKQNIGRLGENLIFLISQPRAGSTLLQKILGSHTDIHTVSEPWVMLPLLGPLSSNISHSASYDSDFAQKSAHDFIKGHISRTQYIDMVRNHSVSLYNAELSSSHKKRFLDKTPRYYSVIPELYEAFPQAQFIILLRNPLAVFCSVWETWAKHRMTKLSYSRYDLLDAPQLLLEGIKLLGDQAITVRYEDIVACPEECIYRIHEELSIPVNLETIQYDKKKWELGDVDTIHAKDTPSSGQALKWIASIKDPQVWRLTHEYLEILGRKTVEEMGYSYGELMVQLKKNEPDADVLVKTDSFDALLNENTLFAREIQKKSDAIASHQQLIQSHEQTIQSHEQTIQSHEQTIQSHEQTINRKDEIITDKNRSINRLKEIIKTLEARVLHTEQAYSYRLGLSITWPIRKIYHACKALTNIQNPFTKKYRFLSKKPPQTFFFLHIPKTAGMTFKQVIRTQYDPEKICEVGGFEGEIHTLSDQFEHSSKEYKGSLKAVMGHMFFGLHEYFVQDTGYVTIVRDPVARRISNYYYVRRTKEHEDYERCTSMTLKEWIAYDRRPSGMTWRIAAINGKAPTDSPQKILERAKKHLREHFVVIGLTERFNETLILCKRLFGWDDVSYVSENVTEERPHIDTIDKSIIKEIGHIDAMDMELYAYAKELFEVQLKAQDASFWDEVKELSANSLSRRERVRERGSIE